MMLLRNEMFRRYLRESNGGSVGGVGSEFGWRMSTVSDATLAFCKQMVVM